jgi:hypothetical protein
MTLDSPILSDPYQSLGCECPAKDREGGFCRTCGSYHPAPIDPEVLVALTETQARGRRVAQRTERQRRTLEN